METVFVGGGTPTLLAPGLLGRVLGTLAAVVPRAVGAEITVEANPETVTEAVVEALVAGGVNRVSIGCQSFDPRHLRTLERWHDPASVPRAVGLVRDGGISSFNLDLIFAVPGQTLDDWLADLDLALALGPDHVSCYGLTYEPGTAMTSRRDAGAFEPAPDELEVAMYEAAIDRLAAAGFEHYEISAWAKPGRRCRHNLVYWNNGNWQGLGPSAGSHVNGLRWTNERHLGRYLETSPWPPIIDVELPDADRHVGETLMLRLRLLDGIPEHELQTLLELHPPRADERRREIEHAIDEVRLARTDGRVHLTRTGLLTANDVITSLL